MALDNPEAIGAAPSPYRGLIGEIVDSFPWLTTKIVGVEAWIWIAMPALFIGSYMLARFVLSFLLLVSDSIRLANKKWVQRYVHSIANPLSLLFAGLVFSAAQTALPITASTLAKLSHFNSIIFTIAITWIVLVYVDTTFEVIRKRLLREGRATSSALIPLMRKIANTTLVTLAVLFLMQNLGFDVAALIAALGVGGIALALASQKSVENLLGGIMISLDQPVRIGDLGLFGSRVGTVEDIGLRSTKIRTKERTLLSIPNSEMATIRIENYAARDMMLFEHVLGLRYDTSPDQLRYIIMRLKDILLAHPMLAPEPARPRLIRFGASSLDVEVTAYIKTNDRDKFEEVQEDVLLRIMDLVEEAGSGFAYPSQTLYMERGSAIDADKKKTIQDKVEAYRAEGKLQWPVPTALHVTNVVDTISYPPEGSAARR